MGKLGSQGRLNTVAPGKLVNIIDQISNRRFLVDTGASFSVFPHFSSDPTTGPALYGAAGKIIPCWGEKVLQLCFNGKPFEWTFLLAVVSFPILGVDFFRHFQLSVNPAANRLEDSSGCQHFSTVSSVTGTFPPAVAAVPPRSPVSSTPQSPVISTPQSPVISTP